MLKFTSQHDQMRIALALLKLYKPNKKTILNLSIQLTVILKNTPILVNIGKVYSIDLARRPREIYLDQRPPRMTVNLQIGTACVRLDQIKTLTFFLKARKAR